MLAKESTGLIVVDIQGKLARLVHDSATLLVNCEKLIRGASLLDLPVIFLEQNPARLGPTVEELSVLSNDFKPISKFTFNACESPEFIDMLRAKNLDTWLVCGIETHICVYQTVTGLAELGFNVQLVGDCVSSRTLHNKELGISRLQGSGVIITGLEMCLYELVKDCREPEFKEILSLVK